MLDMPEHVNTVPHCWS